MRPREAETFLEHQAGEQVWTKPALPGGSVPPKASKVGSQAPPPGPIPLAARSEQPRSCLCPTLGLTWPQPLCPRLRTPGLGGPTGEQGVGLARAETLSPPVLGLSPTSPHTHLARGRPQDGVCEWPSLDVPSSSPYLGLKVLPGSDWGELDSGTRGVEGGKGRDRGLRVTSGAPAGHTMDSMAPQSGIDRSTPPVRRLPTSSRAGSLQGYCRGLGCSSLAEPLPGTCEINTTG